MNNNSLKLKSEELQDEIDNKKEELSNLEKTYSKKEKDILGLEDREKENEERICKQELQIGENGDGVRLLEEDNKRLSKECEILDKKIDSQRIKLSKEEKTRRKNINDSIKDVEKDLDDKNNKLIDVTTKLKETRKQYSEINEKIVLKKEEESKLKFVINSNKKDIGKVKDQKENIIKKYNKINESIKLNSIEQKALINTIRKQENNVAGLEEKIKGIDKKIKEKESRSFYLTDFEKHLTQQQNYIREKFKQAKISYAEFKIQK